MSFPGDVLSVAVPCDVHAPVAVRDALAQAHDGGWSLDDGLLVASELVGNAVRHSGCGDSHEINVDVGHRAGNLLISVHDPGVSGEAAEPASTPVSDPGGWGLRIIERLSLRWGTERPDGYRVWAELPAGSHAA
ncbi:MAG: ATP-binding protein [Solirubrobacteraceae bacterium]